MQPINAKPSLFYENTVFFFSQCMSITDIGLTGYCINFDRCVIEFEFYYIDFGIILEITSFFGRQSLTRPLILYSFLLLLLLLIYLITTILTL